MPIMQLRRQRQITFDFSGLVGVNPAALALLTAILKEPDGRRLIARDSKLIWPKSDSVTNYLLRMDFLKILVGQERYDEGDLEPFTREERCEAVCRRRRRVPAAARDEHSRIRDARTALLCATALSVAGETPARPSAA